MRLIRYGLCCLLVVFTLASAAWALKTEDLAAAEARALNGDIMSQVDVGDYYYARSRFAEALKWYQMAAKQGQFDSRARIAHMYVHGEGTAVDLVKGYVLYRKILQNYVLYPESQQYYDSYVEELAGQLSKEQLEQAEELIKGPWRF